MTFLPLFPLPFGGVYPLHASGAVRTVFSPVGFGGKERPADSAAFPASPAHEGGFQRFIKGQDSGNKPAAEQRIADTLYTHARLCLLYTSYLPYPRFLLKMDISHTAKLLYALLLDRSTLSQKNGWQDSEEMCIRDRRYYAP